MKIAIFGHKRIPGRDGGVEVVVEELATRMAQLGPKVVCYNRRGRYGGKNAYGRMREFKGVVLKSVFTVRIKGFAAASSSFFAAIRCAIGSYDVVHIHAEGPAAMTGLLKLFKKRVIVTIHGLDWKRAKWGGFAKKYIRWGERQAVKHADVITVLNNETKEYFKKVYIRDTVVIPNAVNRVENTTPNLIKTMWGLEKDSYILFSGRIVPEKGLDYLMDAWSEVATDKKLVISGSCFESRKYYTHISSKADDRVIFTGFQEGEALAELYSNAYLFVLPSDVEGMSISLLEAMSYGNCCLVSDIPDNINAIEDKAVTFRHSDADDLKCKLKKLLEEESVVKKYKDASAEYIYNKYSWDDIVDRYLKVYKEV